MLVVRFLFVLGTLFNSLSADDGDTDKFTYDRKLLDKMIRLEIKMEQMENEMKSTEENVRLFTQNHTKWLENKTAELQLLEGRIDIPLIAFSAYSPTDVSPDTNQIFIWQSVRINEGNAYDTVTGIFHAPVSGLYYFAVHVCNYSSQTVQYAIVLEENIIARTYKYDNENNDCGSMNTVIMVTEGQRVWVKCTSGSTSNQIWESSGRSSFIGALMHKEETDQFDYDAEILDKMIRMELKVEEMDKEMREIQSNAIYLLEKVSRVLDNKTEELLLLESRVDLLMIAFSAYNPIDLSLDTNQILILQTVPLNEGDGYNNVLGTFTAPVTGLYLFTAHVCNYSGRGVYYDIVLEYTTIARSTQYNTAQYDCSSVSAITMVTADQRVWVVCTSGRSNNQLYEDSHRQTSFAGVLLQR